MHETPEEITDAPEQGVKTFLDRFRIVAAAHPERSAIGSATETLTFGELHDFSDALAHDLIARGVGRESRVGLFADRSVDSILGLLAIWKAGGAYVPIDAALPFERVRSTLKDAGAAWLVGSKATPSGAPPGVELVHPTRRRGDGSRALPDVRGPDLAYVIYTSGSSGQPKGVMIEHRSIVTLWMGLRAHLPSLPERQRIATLNAPLSFDASVQQLVLLLDGYTLKLVPERCRRDPTALLDLLAAETISLLDCTPTHLTALLASGLAQRSAPSVLLIGGEPIPAAAWKELGATTKIAFNVYGPTETTVDATIQRIVPSSETVSVGRPLLPAIVVRILEDDLRPVLDGEVGELCIGGPGVARGYLGRPDLTRERFLVDPIDPAAGTLYRTGDFARRLPDGSLELLGRRDDQVKIRGHRIELGEVRAALADLPNVTGAAVLTALSALGDKQIVAFAAPASLDPEALRAGLRQRLPDYMIPALLRVIDAIPLLESGKIDRPALLAQLEIPEEPALSEPLSEREERVLGVWRSLLGVHRIPTNADFFAIGGHSLLAVRLVERLRSECGLELPLTALFLDPTIAGIARAASTIAARSGSLRLLQQGENASNLVCFHPIGGDVLSYRPLLAFVGGEPTVHGVRSRAIEGSEREHEDPNAMIRDYADLIAAETLDRPHLVGWSMGGFLAIAVAHHLEQLGLAVGSVQLWDCGRRGLGTAAGNREIFLALRVAMGAVFGAVIETFTAEELAALTDAFAAVSSSAKERMDWLVDWATKEGVPLADFDRGLAERRLELCLDHMRLFSGFVPAVIAAPIDVTWAQESMDKHAATLTDWRAFSAGPTTVQVVGGDHYAIMKSPAIAETARPLRDRLRGLRG